MAINKKTGMNLLMAVVVLLVLYYLFMMGKPNESYQDLNESPAAGGSPITYPTPYPELVPQTGSPVPMMMMDDKSGGISGILEDQVEYAPVDFTGPDAAGNASSCAMNSGVGLASSLLPYKEAKQENYSDFAPEEILKGQNFLDPRQQIGFPETIGGTLRNGNQQIRADPPNPKQGFLWNNSTIVPDLMQRTMCT
jgi:hypothetical protein